jgi:hypothetical protein
MAKRRRYVKYGKWKDELLNSKVASAYSYSMFKLYQVRPMLAPTAEILTDAMIILDNSVLCGRSYGLHGGAF